MAQHRSGPFGLFGLRSRRSAATSTLYPWVYVNADGTARELHSAEREYLETEFAGGDGGRPYIKSNYKQLDGWGEIAGYLRRSKLPKDLLVQPVPVDDPTKTLGPQDMIKWLRAKGLEVTEHADGTFSTSNPTVHYIDVGQEPKPPRE